MFHSDIQTPRRELKIRRAKKKNRRDKIAKIYNSDIQTPSRQRFLLYMNHKWVWEATAITTAAIDTVNGVYEEEALFSYSGAEISFHASLTLPGAVSEESSDLKNGGGINCHHNCRSSLLAQTTSCDKLSSCVISALGDSSLFQRRIKGDFDKRVGYCKLRKQPHNWQSEIIQCIKRSCDAKMCRK